MSDRGRPARTILVVQHEDQCPPGWLGEAWEDAGLALDVRAAYRAVDERHGLPCDLDEFAAVVVLGGEMGANDDDTHPWLASTKSLLREAVSTGVPTLGVCLGHQLLAVALGGVARRNPAGRALGLQPLGLTDAGADDPLLHGLDARAVVQLNNDIVAELPAGATTLARAPDGSVQAARFAHHAWGVQFHPEAGPDIFEGWTIERTHEVDPDAIAADVRARAGDLRDLNDVLARRFAELVASVSDAARRPDSSRS